MVSQNLNYSSKKIKTFLGDKHERINQRCSFEAEIVRQVGESSLKSSFKRDKTGMFLVHLYKIQFWHRTNICCFVRNRNIEGDGGRNKI